MRHHVAECLVRLYLAVASHGGTPDDSIWLSIVDGPTRTKDLVDRALELLESEASQRGYWRLVIDEDVVEHDLDAANRAVDVSSQWLRRAMDLLVAADLDLNAGHNKVKHGLAVRARDNLRTAFTTTAPDADGHPAGQRVRRRRRCLPVQPRHHAVPQPPPG